jgi:hypothetical protein
MDYRYYPRANGLQNHHALTIIRNTLDSFQRSPEENVMALLRTLIDTCKNSQDKRILHSLCQNHLIPAMIHVLANRAQYDANVTHYLRSVLQGRRETYTPQQTSTVVPAPRLLPRQESRRNVPPVVTPTVTPIVTPVVSPDDDHGKCIICTENNANTIFLKCCHCCVCKECWQRPNNNMKNCPMCRAHIEKGYYIQDGDYARLKRDNNMYYKEESNELVYVNNEEYNRKPIADREKFRRVILSSRLLIQAPWTQDSSLEIQDPDVELKKLLFKLLDTRKPTKNVD